MQVMGPIRWMIRSSDGTWMQMAMGLSVSSKWLTCSSGKDSCDVVWASDDWVETETRARVHGWHIFHGYSETGKRLDVYLCPTCVGTPRSKVLKPAPEYLEGQLDLLEGEGGVD